uniref:Acetyl-coenzyme A transporter 1 n=1 Tax=Schizaphis graminum TaxID=13262 RepID=A0A2S2P6J7_SCHGA
MVITTMIAIFKTEKDNTQEDGYVRLNISKTYSLLWDIIKLPSIRILATALLTARIGFAATDSISVLKLIEAGISKEDIMVINTAMYGVKMILPLIIAKYTSGPKPLSLYLKVTPIRLLWNIVFIVLIYYTPEIININGVVNIPIYYYAIFISILSIQEVLSYMMFVAILAFFSRISDPRFGGTYMTLLNTLSNLGFVWTSTVALQLIDLLTTTKCSFDSMNNCSTLDLQNICKANEGNCIVTINGYYVEMIPCTIIGIAWYIYFKNILKNLQIRSPSHWLVNIKKPVTENVEESYPLAVTV